MTLKIFLLAGLGNKLFQYAFIKSLSKKYNISYQIYGIHDRYIHNMNLWMIDQLNIKNYKILSLEQLIYKANEYATDIDNPNIEEIILWFQPLSEHLGYYEYNLEILQNNIIIGYFQNEKYFQNIEDELRDELKEPPFIKPIINHYIANFLHVDPLNILENICIIHIRLGDYRNSNGHFINLENYYLKCIKDIIQNIENPMFLIMTENINEVQEVYPNLIPSISNGKYAISILPTNIENTDTYIDIDCFHFYLMSRVKTIVCANSTFSWWGAWINPHKEKIVYIPSRWLNGADNFKQFPFIGMKGAKVIEV